MPTLELDPPTGYVCDEHETNLTEEVRAKLMIVQEVAGLLPSRRKRRRKLFKVIVTCPGRFPGTEHECQFIGHYTVRG
jgi:hypothetical protein